MRVGIAGVGGIGSNVAVNLVRAGYRGLKLVDMDRVEASNLNRQFYFHDQVGEWKVQALRENLDRIAPGSVATAQVLRLTENNIGEVFADCSVIVEGFDDQGGKKMLLESFGASGKVVVSANGIAGRELGGVRLRRFGNCEIVGDFVTDFRGAELYCPKIQLVAAMMADRVFVAIERLQRGR